MTRPTRLLLAGVIASAAVAITGVLSASRFEDRLGQQYAASMGKIEQSEKQCADQWLRAHPDGGFEQPSAATEPAPQGPMGTKAAPSKAEATKLDAEFAPLLASAQCSNTTGREKADADLRTARETAEEIEQWAPRVAGGILAVLAAPWLWYFLLRRIAELRAAIGGKPPLL